MRQGPLKCLIYGAPGVRKTLHALTVGEVGQIMDLDGGVECALGSTRLFPADKYNEDRLKVDLLQYPERESMTKADAYENFFKHLLAIANLTLPNATQKYPYKVLIIDSFTTLCDCAMRYVLRNTGRLNRPVDVKSNITQPEWGLMINEVEKCVTLIRGMDLHVLLLAHSVPVKNDNGAIVKHEISIPTQRLPPRIPAYFDELWYYETQPGNGPREVLIKTTNSFLYDAKSRAGLRDGTSTSIGMKEIFKSLGREL